jgi:DNA polymerase III subunit alpha
MNNEDFAHLHIHDQYSELDGLGSCEDYVKRAKELGFKYLASTNHGNINGLIRFQKCCAQYEITPIHGCELYVVNDIEKKEKGEFRGHVCVFVKNKEGWNNLTKMLTRANVYGFYYRPRIDLNYMLKNSEGLIFSTACTSSFLRLEGGPEVFAKLQRRLKDDVYIELMPHTFDDQLNFNKALLSIAGDKNIKTIATNDCHYPLQDDSRVHDILLLIQSKAKIGDKKAWQFSAKDLYLKSAKALERSFIKQGILTKKQLEFSMRNTIELAEKCSQFKIEKVMVSLPEVPGVKGDDDKFLMNLIKKGFNEKVRGKERDEEKYIKRYIKEFEFIKKKNFVRYFLIVWELINWAKKNEIMVGPGRGSVSGCLIAYLIGITNVNPFDYDLLFERFISEGRVDFPDIDIDFEDLKKDMIRGHLKEIYGEYNIANISTFMQMKGKLSLRDVARVYDIDNKEVDQVAKLVDNDDDLKKVLENEESGKQFYDKYKDQCDIALRLKGQIRGRGQHAAAVVICNHDLRGSDRCNLVINEKAYSVNWDKKDAEYMGMLKLDTLSLSNLTMMRHANELIKKNYNKIVEFEHITFDDKNILEQFAKGNSIGCFQFSSHGLRNLCKQLKIDNFELLITASALHRPAVLKSGLVDEFIKRKNENIEWQYTNKTLNEILSPTYGIIVFQEQLMRIVVEVAGLTFLDADKIRKIFEDEGFKDLSTYEKQFVDGCINRGKLKRKEAEEIWGYLTHHGGYGFNKAHSTAYTMISYWNMYLKYYYPVEFICACLTYNPQMKKEELLKEAFRMGLKVVPPKVNISHHEKWEAHKGKIYMPFSEIKGIGSKSSEKLKEGKGLSTRLKNLLNEIKAFDDNEITLQDEIVDKYLSVNINVIDTRSAAAIAKIFARDESVKVIKSETAIYVTDRTKARKRLDVEDLMNCNIDGLKLDVSEKKQFVNKSLLSCKDCELHKECDKPILPKSGDKNFMIISEYPLKGELRDRQLFAERSSIRMWDAFEKFDLDRSEFYLTSFVKCHPSVTKNPTQEQIEVCSRWLFEEISIIKPPIILAFGNVALKCLLREEGGIMKKNASIEWVNKVNSWVVWCMNSSSLYYHPENISQYEEAISNYCERVKKLSAK